ncbi:DUF453-domain-containing protein [Pluteus cervinus]|uniref:DUF453-domain-containing protein n=1 Tax=Pluteus cervinus TaxID=181527 RepID=A0ACD3ASE2_9AGAR|nr:DUF453-domain-containing protein [Pluteus cervinus]
MISRTFKQAGSVISRHNSSYAPLGTSNPIPATFIRGGTSKGIFIQRSELPQDKAAWEPIFLGIMGSPDAEYGRQLNGMGGGVSSLSKIMVVGPPQTEDLRAQGVHAEYTFVQVGVKDASIDYSGNCGNLSSVVGVYALDEGICDFEAVTGGERPQGRVRLFNTNTQKIIETTFPIQSLSDSAGHVAQLDLQEVAIAGVSGSASQILLDFVNPGGARTGKLLPTGLPTDTLSISTPSSGSQDIPTTLLDATNPTVFVLSSDLEPIVPFHAYTQGTASSTDTELVSNVLESLRRQGAEKMGLDPEAQAQPKIAIISTPLADGRGDSVDIVVHALSMGVLHKAVPMTVGLCLGVAANVQGTLPWQIVTEVRRLREQNDAGSSAGTSELVKIRHPGGVVDVGAEFAEDGTVKSARVVRTGRRLMKGVVWW